MRQLETEQMELDTLNGCTIELSDYYKPFIVHPCAVISEPRPSCLANPRIRVTLALRNMLPDDEQVIEGVETRRTSRDCSVVFVVGSRKFSSVEDAAEAILLLAH